VSMMQQTALTKAIKEKKQKSFLHEMYKNRILTLMVLPMILYVFLFAYMPMAGIVLAFKNFVYSKGIFGSDWVGLDNFMFLFKSGMVLRVTFNTVIYNIAFMVINTILQIFVAILITEISGKYFKKTVQTMLLMPFFISWVVAGAIVFNLLSYNSGVINHLLASLGYKRINFMNQEAFWPFIIVIFNAWKGVGYGSIVYMAAITGIDKEIYQAAEIDGASIFQCIFNITLPQLKPTVIVLILLGLGRIVSGDFAMFYNLTGNNALLYNVTDIVDTFVFRSLMQNHDFAMSAAAGIYQSVLGFIIIMTVNTVIRRVQPDYALF
jgi:putative aldouronate transport system permease protein